MLVVGVRAAGQTMNHNSARCEAHLHPVEWRPPLEIALMIPHDFMILTAHLNVGWWDGGIDSKKALTVKRRQSSKEFLS